MVQTTAQPVQSATSLGLSGSGMAYISGPEATFWNPANLMIADRPGRFHLSVGTGAFSFDPVFPESSVRTQLASYRRAYRPYKPGSFQISKDRRQKILEMHYPGNTLLSTHRQQADLLLAGALWKTEHYSLSIALRGRYGSTFKVGRGWYDGSSIQDGQQHIRDFSLIQRRSELYELAIGYAREFTFVNGLLPGANTLYIGITPKFIVAGPHLNARYDARYLQETDEDIQPVFNTFSAEFKLQSSGSHGQAFRQYRQNGRAQQAIDDNFSSSYSFKPTGYGIGFDFGLNYVIPLGYRNFGDQASKSLRIGLSFNDIGAVRYHKQPFTLESERDTTKAALQAPVQQMFTGAGGQYINYLHRASSLPNPLLTADSPSEQSYTALLPTSINTGLLLDLKHLKLMGDLAIGLDNTAFSSKNIILNLGMEARLLKQIPIRLGTTLAKNRPFTLGLGTGLETRNWDFNLGTTLLLQSHSPEAYFTGGAFGGLQLHF